MKNELDDYCVECVIIQCTKCDEVSRIYQDIDYAIEMLTDKGWRGTAKHCYCPFCAEKHLKPKSK